MDIYVSNSLIGSTSLNVSKCFVIYLEIFIVKYLKENVNLIAISPYGDIL